MSDCDQEQNNYPNVPLRASVSPDGERITVIFPHEFIDANVVFLADNWGRHRVAIDPTYGGRSVIGFVDEAGVKHGKIEINPASLSLSNLVPRKTSSWWAKQRETDLLIGKLLTDLCEQQIVTPPPVAEKVQVRQVVIEKPITIEDALTFINQWAKEHGANLVVEQNMLYAEVRKRWEGKR